MLVGHYDLEYNPPTFDVVTFLLQLEEERIRLKEQDCRIEIQPGPWEGFREDRHRDIWPHTPEERRKTLANIVIPMCELLASSTRITNHVKRISPGGLDFGFNKYTVPFKNFVRCIKSGVAPLRPKYETPKDEKLVTITLREAPHWPDRNSKVNEWFKVAANLIEDGYNVKVIRDYAYEEMPLDRRAQLYRSAFCNLGISNGQMWFAIACNAPVCMLRPYTNGGHIFNSTEYIQSIGLLVDNFRPFNNMYQMIVPKDDTVANIMQAFCLFRDMEV